MSFIKAETMTNTFNLLGLVVAASILQYLMLICTY